MLNPERDSLPPPVRFAVLAPSSSSDAAAGSALTIWMTGLSGAGKSTIAESAAASLAATNTRVFILDGDVVRQGLCGDLGFSAADRAENIRRVAEVARILNLAGITVLVALISPFDAERARARQIIGAARFREVFVSTSIELCEQRDIKGLYRKARAGLIPDFTGISSPYEAPQAPDLQIDTAQLSLAEATRQVLALCLHPHNCS